MVGRICALAIVGAASTGAMAASTLATGPAPAWVTPASLPALPAGPDKAAVRVLLQDQQVDLQPGHVTRYSESVFRIQTPQGLAAGNIALAWNPDTESATVHKLVVRRGDKVIDVLANQKFTVVRRESNLENAVLDGVLTATIQPEGLQVGDVIDFSASITQSDPALGSHVEEIGGGWNGVPIDHAHLRVRWPSAVHMQVRATTGLPPLKVERNGKVAGVELSLDHLPPLPAPKGAPARYAVMRVAEMSDFASWADVARLMAPLYEKAAALRADSALRKEMAAIAAKSADPKARAEAALALVQDRVRYVFLGMNDGGLVPADADTTWQRRFGDCKGKTALLLALLHGLGVEAEPVVVNAGGGDGLDQRLPMIALFNHVLVRATIAGRTYWLDGTRTGDTALDQIRTPDFRWGLPLVPNAALVQIDAPAPAKPLAETAIRIDATAGLSLPAPMHVESILRDDAAVALNQQISNLAPDMLDRGLREYWRNRFDFVTVTKTAARFDPARREETLVMDGQAKMDWNNGWYEADGVGVGYKADFTRDPGPDRDAPFAVAFPYFNRTSETILLPPGEFRLSHGDAVDETAGGIAYKRTVSLAGNRFMVEEEERGIEREFPASAAQGEQAKLRALADKDVFIGTPLHYRITDRELQEMMRTPPATADGLVQVGNALLDRNRFEEAEANFTHAISLDPKNVWAYADRGLAYAEEDKLDLAARDLNTAAGIDANNPVVLRGRAYMADLRDAIPDAVAAWSRSLEREPDSLFALARRANDYRVLGDEAHAIADANAILQHAPKFAGLYLLRANAYLAAGKTAEALQQASLLVAADPDESMAHVVAGRILARLGRWEDAERAFAAALKISASPYIYINRSLARPAADLASRQADLDAAAKLDPRSADLLAARAQLQEDRKQYTEAAATWTASLALNASDPYALVRRGIDEQRLGKPALATADFTAAHALAKDADMLGALCHEKARAGVGLDLALAECKAALVPAPTRPDLLDSMGLVELRLGHVDEAAKAYDEALSKLPTLASALYGRALVETRRGQASRAATDKQAALEADGNVASGFGDIP